MDDFAGDDDGAEPPGDGPAEGQDDFAGDAAPDGQRRQRREPPTRSPRPFVIVIIASAAAGFAIPEPFWPAEQEPLPLVNEQD